MKTVDYINQYYLFLAHLHVERFTRRTTILTSNNRLTSKPYRAHYRSHYKLGFKCHGCTYSQSHLLSTHI